MRLLLLTMMTVSLLGCGATSTSSTDASADAIPGDGADDTAALGSDATSTDAIGTDTASAEVTGTDAVVAETITSDSPWTGTLFVNEIQAGGTKKNLTVATDGDWFELYNVGAKDLDLSACKVGGLTNGLAGANPLPTGTSIAAGGFLVVYYNHVNLGVPVINAGIKSDGSMAIWDTGGLLVDSIDWNEGASPAGSTYDRTPDGSATWKTVSPPTPGQPNSK